MLHFQVKHEISIHSNNDVNMFHEKVEYQAYPLKTHNLGFGAVLKNRKIVNVGENPNLAIVYILKSVLSKWEYLTRKHTFSIVRQRRRNDRVAMPLFKPQLIAVVTQM